MNKERQKGSLKFIFDADLVPLNSYCMSLGIIVTFHKKPKRKLHG